MKKTEQIPGGLSKNISILDIAKRWTSDDKDITYVLDMLLRELNTGTEVELEHTNDLKIAKEIAKDHLYEDPNYYSKLKKIEATECTGSDSAGGFDSKIGGAPIKKEIHKIPNFKEYEFKEATDASSSGSYDVPFGSAGKNPLKIGGVKSIQQSRAVRDKKFPKWGGPGGKFVKIKDKCKTFPYCNQGDINSLELYENKSGGYLYKTQDVSTIINESIFKEAQRIIMNDVLKNPICESEDTIKYIAYHIVDKNKTPIDTCESMEMAESKLKEYKKKYPKKELLIDKRTYDSYDDMFESLEKMAEEINENNKQNKMNKEHYTECGDKYEKILRGESKKTEVSDESHVCEKCGEEICECETVNESKVKRVIRLSESQMKKLITKIVSESHPGIVVTKDVQTVSKKINDENADDVGKKMKKYLTFDGNDNPEFPKQIGKGDKVVAPKLSKEDEEYVEDYRGGNALNLTYDQEPSKQFKDRLKNSLEGDSETGNSQESENPGINIIKSDLGKEMGKNSERKIKKIKSDPMYKKDKQPVNEMKIEKSSLDSDIEKMKKLYTYNKKTQ
jgi:hypothetical protein